VIKESIRRLALGKVNGN